MSFSERWSAFWGDDVDKALAGKDFVIVTLRDYYYYEYAIDMRQIRELLKEDFVESILVVIVITQGYNHKILSCQSFVHIISPKCTPSL